MKSPSESQMLPKKKKVLAWLLDIIVLGLNLNYNVLLNLQIDFLWSLSKYLFFNLIQISSTYLKIIRVCLVTIF